MKQFRNEIIPAGGTLTVVVEFMVKHEGDFEGEIPIFVYDGEYRELIVTVRGRGIKAQIN